MARATPRIGFVGIGAMGAPMAGCLLKDGYQLAVYDSNPDRMAAFAKDHGIEPAATLADLGKESDVVITILPNSAIVEEVLFGPQGLASSLRAGAVVIEMTSGIPSQTVAFSERLARQGVVLFDAPVSGGVPRARTGELTIMAGGEQADIDAAMPILNALGSVIPTGKVGSGHAMKALNNLVSSAGFLIGIEALIIGSRFGIDPETMVDVLNVSTGMNNSTQKKFKQYVLSRKFDSGFAMSLMVKDLTIALGIAHENNVNAPFADLCRNLWAGANAVLGPQADHTAVALLSEQLAGIQISKPPKQ
ncbi:NAD(P)-dependent oxidoreductase [Pollutimonas sp. M17]|uniref:NAD(P)-dependent oxidoreductase n=1 Tax=Pollutimonas sp. M17 TaxID=2962065 RepID=UPI0021F4513B|nr:NAD(P)-dependent oxidoreductase [Pollutimonas sp. M17]UYO93186.1 NAD(P)-dependent oxidoreductase [Pollutimonas sp. M17]